MADIAIIPDRNIITPIPTENFPAARFTPSEIIANSMMFECKEEMDKILMERTVGNSLDNLSTLISVNERRLAEEKNRIRAGKMHMSAIDPSNREYYEAIKEMYGWERGKVEAFPDFK